MIKSKKIIAALLLFVFSVSLTVDSVFAYFVQGDYYLQYSSNGVDLQVVEYKGNDQNVVIPDLYGLNDITDLNVRSFSGCTFIESVTLPANAKRVFDNVFENCTSLTSITIPNTVTVFGEGVFYNCSSLLQANLDFQCESVPVNTFRNCTSLKKVTLSDSVKEICKYSFYGCTSLKNFPTASNIEVIRSQAFTNCGFESINLGNSVKTIEKYAFRNCSNLSEIVIPDSVTSIGDNAFANCSPDLVVKTDSDYVKSYCQANGIPVAVNYGDADGDGYVNIKDATFIQKSVVKFDGYEITSGTAQFTKADVDGNGRVNIRDATLIAKFVVHKITKFPVEENT